MKYCSNCEQMAVPNAIACQSCGMSTQASGQNSDSQQSTWQQPLPYQLPLQTSEQQPSPYQLPLQTNEQQLSPYQLPQQPYEQQQPIYQQQPPYHQQQQPYGQNPSYQQPTYQQTQQSYSHNSSNQHSYNNHPHNQQSSGQHAYDGYSQHSYVNPEYTTMGGWLLFFVWGAILATIGNAISLIGSIPFLLNLITSDLTMFTDRMNIAVFLRVFINILASGAHVFYVIFLVNIFQRKSTFLRFYQLSLFILIFAHIIHYISADMMVTEFNLLLIQYGYAPEFPDIIVRDELIAIIVVNIMGLLLYTLYYSKSVRVRTYMRGEEYKRKAFFAFNRPPA